MTFSQPPQNHAEPPDDAERRLKSRLSRNLGDLVLESLRDQNVAEIVLNPDGRLWVEKFGAGFKPSGHLPREQGEMVISLMASSQGGAVTSEQPHRRGGTAPRRLPFRGPYAAGGGWPDVHHS